MLNQKKVKGLLKKYSYSKLFLITGIKKEVIVKVIKGELPNQISGSEASGYVPARSIVERRILESVKKYERNR